LQTGNLYFQSTPEHLVLVAVGRWLPKTNHPAQKVASKPYLLGKAEKPEKPGFAQKGPVAQKGRSLHKKSFEAVFWQT
jgi:hypothetical protein